MNIELFLPYEKTNGILNDELRILINKCIKFGWNGVVLTNTIYKVKNLPLPPEPILLSKESEFINERNYGLYCLSDYSPFPQFTRLNLETDSMEEIHSFNRQLSTLKYTLFSITPLSEHVYKYVCQNSEIDILSLDISKYIPKGNWKDLKTAINRGIYIELRYSQILFSSNQRQTFFSTCSSIIHVTRGKNIIFGFGIIDSDKIRQPSDLIHLATLLQIKNPLNITNILPKKVISLGLSRQSHVGITRKMKKLSESESEDDFLIKIINE